MGKGQGCHHGLTGEEWLRLLRELLKKACRCESKGTKLISAESVKRAGGLPRSGRHNSVDGCGVGVLAALVTHADDTGQSTKPMSYKPQRPGRTCVSEGCGEGTPQPQNRPPLCRVFLTGLRWGSM